MRTIDAPIAAPLPRLPRRWRRGAVAAVGALTLIPTACSTDEGEGTPVLELEVVGSCIAATAPLPATVERLPVVDCAEAHTHEVYAVVDLEGEDYPGARPLRTTTEHDCVEAFEPYVGISPFDSSLRFTWLLPTADSWRAQGDRRLVCLLVDAEGAVLQGSMRGAAR